MRAQSQLLPDRAAAGHGALLRQQGHRPGEHGPGGGELGGQRWPLGGRGPNATRSGHQALPKPLAVYR